MVEIDTCKSKRRKVEEGWWKYDESMMKNTAKLLLPTELTVEIYYISLQVLTLKAKVDLVRVI